MFKIGDKAVYPAHGVGVVEGIENRQISWSSKTFFILCLLDLIQRQATPPAP